MQEGQGEHGERKGRAGGICRKYERNMQHNEADALRPILRCAEGRFHDRPMGPPQPQTPASFMSRLSMGDCRRPFTAGCVAPRPRALSRQGPAPFALLTSRLGHGSAYSRHGSVTARLTHGSAYSRLGSVTARLGHGWAGGSAPTGGASLRPEMAALPPHPTPQPRSSSTAAASSTDCRSPAPAAA